MSDLRGWDTETNKKNTLNKTYGVHWRKEYGKTNEDVVGRCGGGFESDGDQSLEKRSAGQKCVFNNTDGGFGPTWAMMPMIFTCLTLP